MKKENWLGFCFVIKLSISFMNRIKRLFTPIAKIFKSMIIFFLLSFFGLKKYFYVLLYLRKEKLICFLIEDEMVIKIYSLLSISLLFGWYKNAIKTTKNYLGNLIQYIIRNRTFIKGFTIKMSFKALCLKSKSLNIVYVTVMSGDIILMSYIVF